MAETYCGQVQFGMTDDRVPAYKAGVSRWNPKVYAPHDFTRTFGLLFLDAVKAFQKEHSIPQSGVIGLATHNAIVPHLRAPEKAMLDVRCAAIGYDETFAKLLGAMRKLSDNTPGYLLGGQHGIQLSQFSAYKKSDCSSSTSKVLYDCGLFDGEYAIVSGALMAWGVPGVGRYFTVYATVGHVFIRLHRSRWWRFDTSPHGDGGRGPKLRYLPRFSGGFVARHYPGM